MYSLIAKQHRQLILKRVHPDVLSKRPLIEKKKNEQNLQRLFNLVESKSALGRTSSKSVLSFYLNDGRKITSCVFQGDVEHFLSDLVNKINNQKPTAAATTTTRAREVPIEKKHARKNKQQSAGFAGDPLPNQDSQLFNRDARKQMLIDILFLRNQVSIHCPEAALNQEFRSSVVEAINVYLLWEKEDDFIATLVFAREILFVVISDFYDEFELSTIKNSVEKPQNIVLFSCLQIKNLIKK